MKTLIDKAREFAIKAHGNQTYGTGEPYIVHLEAVANVLFEFGFDDVDLVASALLHDTIEDTTVNYSDIKNEFNGVIAELVYAVSDELGRNRKERHDKTYPKIAQSPRAIILKLADRIANVRASVISGDKLDMYKKEYADFRLGLYNGDNLAMWDEIDKLLS